MKEEARKFFKEKLTPFSWRRVWLILLSLAIVLGLFFALLAILSAVFSDRVLPGMAVGEAPIGGMKADELKTFLDRISDKMFNEGLVFSYEKDPSAGSPRQAKKSFTVYPLLAAEDHTRELVNIDIAKESAYLMNYGKNEGWISNGLQVLKSRLEGSILSLSGLEVDKNQLLQILKSKLGKDENPPHNANVKITSLQPLDYELVPEQGGMVFDCETAVSEAENNWRRLKNPVIIINKKEIKPNILTADIESIANRLSAVLSAGGLELAYTDSHTKEEFKWFIKQETISQWLEAQRTVENGLGWGLNKEAVANYLTSKIAGQVEVEAKDAKFKTDDSGRVIEFQGSRSGVGLDIEQTCKLINEAFLGRTWHDEGVAKTVALAVKVVEPKTKTGDVNNLGIKEVLGVGISNFKGSPKNRILNIKNAVNKLNGVLIKPSEEFSALANTGPFTKEGGYLPELVIKGDEIKPEIGGGLCQIGTTLFRMAMNSGMKITSRRNHSLVVNYYNDISNGNPGTDATVYEPAPDFKFLNDTQNYVLIQTYMDVKEQKLYFTLWGASDGRQGYYSSPVVKQWLLYEKDKKIVETDKLKPGEEKCQHAYMGANASFIYTRELTDGKKEETVFESHYRPLPEICLVGVEAAASSTPALDEAIAIE